MPDAPVFVDLKLAARIEAGEAGLAAAVARGMAAAGRSVAVDPLAGGLAVLSAPGMPTNKIAGCGFGEPLALDALTAIEARWWAAAEPVRFELASVAPVALHQTLVARGYVLDSFEHVLVRRIGPADATAVLAPGVTVEEVTPATAAAWLEVSIDGFGTPDDDGPTAPPPPPREVLEPLFASLGTSDLPRYLARVDGEPAGVASARFADGMVQLCGAATAPRFRRRGVQRALLTTRLAQARALDCEFAIVTTAPASQSQANVTRLGFTLAYVRAVLARSAPSPG